MNSAQTAEENDKSGTTDLYRFCTADSAFRPVWPFLLIVESITYMFSILPNVPIPTGSTTIYSRKGRGAFRTFVPDFGAVEQPNK
jgi:hypothetical protein